MSVLVSRLERDSDVSLYDLFIGNVQKGINEGNLALREVINRVVSVYKEHSKARLDFNETQARYGSLAEKGVKIVRAKEKREARLDSTKVELESKTAELQEEKYTAIIDRVAQYPEKVNPIKAEIEKLEEKLTEVIKEVQDLQVDKEKQSKNIKKNKNFFRKKGLLADSLVEKDIESARERTINEKKNKIKAISNDIVKKNEEIEEIKRGTIGSSLNDVETETYYDLLETSLEDLQVTLMGKVASKNIERNGLVERIEHLNKELQVLKSGKRAKKAEIIESKGILDEKQRVFKEKATELQQNIKDISDLIGMDIPKEIDPETLASKIAEIKIPSIVDKQVEESSPEIGLSDLEPKKSFWEKFKLWIISLWISLINRLF